MMKTIVLGISALLLLAGCSSNQPKPAAQAMEKQTVEKKIVKRAPAPRPKSKAEIPPLPEPEVDVDMDNIVEQATNEIMDKETIAAAPEEAIGENAVSAASIADIDMDNVIKQAADNWAEPLSPQQL
jgi:PBP1b-binding outer membrane lipoprotein LpoB